MSVRRGVLVGLACFFLLFGFVALSDVSRWLRQPGPETLTYDLEIEGNRMTPPEITVPEGSRVGLRVSTDRSVDLRVEGSPPADVEPGEGAELVMDVERAGRFEVRDDQTGAKLGALVVEPARER